VTEIQKDKIISEIIASFEKYGLRDVRHNRNRPIAAFILSICFIDTLASFRYPLSINDSAIRSEKFITEYIPIFSSIALYQVFRNAAIHHYSGKRRYAVTNDKTFLVPFEKGKQFTTINTSILIKEIAKGFRKYKKHLLSDYDNARGNALNRNKKHPPFMHKVIR
jgi:hypothetical protein